MDYRSGSRNLICQIALACLVACSPAPVTATAPPPLEVKVGLDYSKVPKRCRPIVDLMINANAENPSRFMGQIEQESGCNVYALSRTGAIGLVQIMPDTLDWGARTFARHLGSPDPHNPRYAIEFLKAYMDYFTVDLFNDYCSNKTVDEQRYNSGYWPVWEVKASNGTLAGAEAICGVKRLPNGKMRSLSSCHENYEYPRYISRRQVKYLAIGGKQCR